MVYVYVPHYDGDADHALNRLTALTEQTVHGHYTGF